MGSDPICPCASSLKVTTLCRVIEKRTLHPYWEYMKILFVLTRADELGGAQVYVRDLALALHADGYDVVVAAGHAGDFAALLEARGIRFVALKNLERPIRPTRDIAAVVELRRVIRAEQPALVSLHSSKAGLIGRVAALAVGVPVVFTAHGWAFTEGVSERRRKMYQVIERAAAPLAKRIITVSDYDRRLALSHKVGDAQRLVRVRNAVPDYDGDAAAGTHSEEIRFVMVARFAAPKNQTRLLHALASIGCRGWRLELIGDGETRADCQQLAEKLGISEQVVFTGEVQDVPARLERSDVFVLISDWEGLPFSIIEAMRAGLPVVASDVGGIGELINDGSNGFLVPRDGEAFLTDRLQTLLQSPERREAMSLASRQRYESEFTFERMYEKTLSIYREVVENHV